MHNRDNKRISEQRQDILNLFSKNVDFAPRLCYYISARRKSQALCGEFEQRRTSDYVNIYA